MKFVTAALLAALVVCAAVEVEAWPLSAWRLFSSPRTADQAGWAVTMVDTAGVERALPFDDLSRGYRGGQHLLTGFQRQPEADQRRLCETWAFATRRQALDVESVRIYRTVTRTFLDGRDPRQTRTLVHECG